MAEELPISEFDYELPPELIAQEPCSEREAARLLVVERATGSLSHHQVRDLPELLQPQDLLIFNNTRVIPARIYGQRAKTGGQWEGLFLERHPNGAWELLGQTRGYLQEGEWLNLLDRQEQPSPYRLQVLGRTVDRHLLVRPEPEMEPVELLEAIGHVPLPPYIRRGVENESDRHRYQTVYAQTPGSIAAPTAGLHFTPALLQRLRENQVEQAFVTLHVGIGTFAPVQVSNLHEHTMHQEWCQLPPETAEALNNCKNRRIAVGTTTVRTLESAPWLDGRIQPWTGHTSLFIKPGHAFRAMDGLLTNFHLPKSTLLVLISALAGRDLIREAYSVAVKERYRFFSYGDAMLIL
ncbi:MAG TPA: tRNA preQ1(34) S-adenosylmethionine ribosyltransferase-isomerase QueA [Gemmatales bacterium]|nr:tRNA preQ1(34) S-adenosylmethionine ribosyltransferase-isomerase QueA [Gemmatales bacterium]